MTIAPVNLGDLSQAARSIATATQTALQAEWAAVALGVYEARWLSTAADTRDDAPFIRIPSDGLLGTWLRQELAVFRSDDRSLAGLRSALSGPEKWLIESAGAQLVAPVVASQSLVGMIVVGPGIAGSVFPVSHLNFLKAISEMSGPIVGAYVDVRGSQAA